MVLLNRDSIRADEAYGYIKAPTPQPESAGRWLVGGIKLPSMCFFWLGLLFKIWVSPKNNGKTPQIIPKYCNRGLEPLFSPSILGGKIPLFLETSIYLQRFFVLVSKISCSLTNQNTVQVVVCVFLLWVGWSKQI